MSMDESANTQRKTDLGMDSSSGGTKTDDYIKLDLCKYISAYNTSFAERIINTG